jgi:crotonobetainyl-CoA:carnitine CoA-transferase CaiB-like acyl-CoA transferase
MLYGVIAEAAPAHSNAVWLEFCNRVSIACMPVVALDDVQHDAHVRDVELFSIMEHPSEGAYRSIRSPVSFSAAPFAHRHHAPRLGEHTREVLAAAGMTEAEIDAVAP